MASPAPPEHAEAGCPAPAPAPAAEGQAPRLPPPPRAPRQEEKAQEAAAAGERPQVEEAAGWVVATVTWLLGEPGLWLGCRAGELLSWRRPLRSLLAFVGANLLFWFLALTPWRVYHLISVMILGRVIMQIIKDMVLSRTRENRHLTPSLFTLKELGAQLWRSLSEREGERDRSHPLICSPNAHRGQDWARPKPRSRSTVWISLCRGPNCWASTCLWGCIHEKKLGLGMVPGLEPRHSKWDGSISTGDLTK